MKNNSLISNLIKTNNDWRDIIKSKDIKIKEDQYHILFMYGHEADFSDDIVKEARGIILRKDTLDVVCWPFNKFGKYYEDYADDIDWSSAMVQEKIDGSIIQLWYDHIINSWRFSSNSEIDARNAHYDYYSDNTIYNLITNTNNYLDLQKIINDNKLNKDYTYIFELVSDNRIIIKYNNNKLYHIGTRNNITGKEYNINIGIDKPKLYNIHSLNDCIALFDKVDKDSNGVTTNCTMEGFVVVDANFHRIKIKNPIYSILHNIKNSNDCKIKLIELIDSNKINISSLSNNFSNEAPILKYYDFKYTELLYELNIFIFKCRKFYQFNGNDRTLLVDKIKNHKFACIGFRSLGNNYSVNELLEKMPGGKINWIAKHIKKYSIEDFDCAFDTMIK